MKIRKTSVVAIAFAALLVGGGTQLYAGDAVRATVSIPAGEITPIITENGNGHTPGTYAVGTIQLFYTVNAFEFPVGTYARFRLELSIDPIDKSPATAYAVPLTVEQNGGENLQLIPGASSFNVTGRSWTDSTIVEISIPAGASDEDGTDLVGNLKISAGGSYHLDTVANVQVHIRLVHPNECLKLYNFLTDQSLTYPVSTTEVNTNKKKDSINSTNPYGQFSENALVVNVCNAAETFDLEVTLDPTFETNPSGNAGNAVATYLMTGEADPSTPISSYGAGTPQGQTLCLQNITLAGGNSLLSTVHMAINKSLLASSLGESGTFQFSAGLFGANSGCTGEPRTDVLPDNPAVAGMTYTIK